MPLALAKCYPVERFSILLQPSAGCYELQRAAYNPHDKELFLGMDMELARQVHAAAIASIQRYFMENMQEPIGDLAAGLLLDYFMQELGPLIYNQAITDAQTRMQLRVADLTGELFADAFQYWSKADSRKRKKTE